MGFIKNDKSNVKFGRKIVGNMSFAKINYTVGKSAHLPTWDNRNGSWKCQENNKNCENWCAKGCGIPPQQPS